MTNRLARAWRRYWFELPWGSETLGLVRIGLGIGLLILHVTQFYTLLGLDLRGPRFHFIDPIWYFELLGVQSMSPVMNWVTFVLLMAATLAMTLGYRTRTAIVLLLVCIAYLKGARDSAAGDVHHRYLMWVHALVFLALSSAGRVLAVDSRKSAVDAAPIATWQSSWPLRAMQTYVAFFYFASAVAKLRVSGLNWVADGTAVQKMLLLKTARWDFDTLSMGYFVAQHPTFCWVAVLMTLGIELSFPMLLFYSNVRFRALFLLGVAGFHLANGIIAGVNFWITPLLFIVFFDLGSLRERWLPRRIDVARLPT
jgi:hypothetical protein